MQRTGPRRIRLAAGGVLLAAGVMTAALLLALHVLLPRERPEIKVLRSPDATAKEKERAAKSLFDSPGPDRDLLAVLGIDPQRRDLNQGVLGPHTLGQVFWASSPSARTGRKWTWDEEAINSFPMLDPEYLHWYLPRYGLWILQTKLTEDVLKSNYGRLDAACGLLGLGAEGLEFLKVRLDRRGADEALGPDTLEKAVLLATGWGGLIWAEAYVRNWPPELLARYRARLGATAMLMTFQICNLPARFGSTNKERREKLVAEIKGIIPASEWEKTSVGLQPWVGSLHQETVSVIQSWNNLQPICARYNALTKEAKSERAGAKKSGK